MALIMYFFFPPSSVQKMNSPVGGLNLVTCRSTLDKLGNFYPGVNRVISQTGLQCISSFARPLNGGTNRKEICEFFHMLIIIQKWRMSNFILMSPKKSKHPPHGWMFLLDLKCSS